MDSWMTISLPLHHVTLISIRYFILRWHQAYDYRTATVRLFKGRKPAESMVWKARGDRVPSPEVYNAKVMSVRFTGKLGFLQFRLLYSFHQQMYRPFRVGEDFWNCSVPKWPEFQRHFRCNLDRECDGWEDETECYYSGHCGQGHLTVNDRCYVYIRAKRLSWRDSNLECQRRGGYLISINTLGEWEAVTAVLKMRRSNRMVLIGLHETPSVLPFLYTGTRMWSDKTVAYFTPYIYSARTNRCAYLHFTYRIYQSNNCDQKLRSVKFLCELRLSSEMLGVNPDTGLAETRSTIRLSVPRNTSLAVPSLKCPDGHVTHAFLACDERSACWARRRGYVRSEARGVPSRTSCPAPMTSLPAMFACGTGARRVPYSLVCDHRPQCADASDETFCVFPPCSGSTPLRCPSSAQGVTFPAMHAMWSEWAPVYERSKLAGFTYSGANLGTVFAMPISGLLADSDFLGGWPSVFYVFGVIGCLWFVVWMLVVHDSPSQHPRISARERHYIESSVGRREHIPTPWRHIFTSSAVWATSVGHFSNNWGFYCMLTGLPTYMKNILHFDIRQSGFLSGAPYLVLWLSEVTSGLVADYLRKRGIFSTATTRKVFNTAGLVLPAVLLVAASYSGCNHVLSVVLLTLGVGSAGFCVAGFNVNHLDIAPRFAGTLYGITNTIANVPGFAAPAVVGALTNHNETTGQWRIIFFIAAAVYLSGALFFAVFSQGEEQPWAQGSPNLSSALKQERVVSVQEIAEENAGDKTGESLPPVGLENAAYESERERDASFVEDGSAAPTAGVALGPTRL